MSEEDRAANTAQKNGAAADESESAGRVIMRG